jgi:hypothetical protein
MTGGRLMAAPDLTGLSDDDVVRQALDPARALVRAHAIDELARRAIDKPALLDAAAKAIGAWKTVETRWGPPLGWLGASRILTSGQPAATERLLQEMNGWTADEQEDLMRLVAGPGRLADLTRDFQEKFGWAPKYRS